MYTHMYTHRLTPWTGCGSPGSWPKTRSSPASPSVGGGRVLLILLLLLLIIILIITIMIIITIIQTIIIMRGEGTVDWDAVASNCSTGNCLPSFNSRRSSKSLNWKIWARWGFPTVSSPLLKGANMFFLNRTVRSVGCPGFGFDGSFRNQSKCEH